MMFIVVFYTLQFIFNSSVLMNSKFDFFLSSLTHKLFSGDFGGNQGHIGSVLPENRLQLANI